MDKKTIYIGIGVLAAVGIAYYFFFKKMKGEKGAGVTANEKSSRQWNFEKA